MATTILDVSKGKKNPSGKERVPTEIKEQESKVPADVLEKAAGGKDGDIEFHDDQPILIIGGTDGSGTRAFVDTLNQLGVVIVADDQNAFDVHASIIFKKGEWPPFLVNTVLQETHSANYRWSDLANDTQRTLLTELSKFTTDIHAKYRRTKLRRHTRHMPARRNGDKFRSAVASTVSFAIKAPVSMTVLPVLRQAFDRPIKFLHVVRE
jgi:hypothetical protein